MSRKIICDNCGKEIHDKPVNGLTFLRGNGDTVCSFDYCDRCVPVIYQLLTTGNRP